jgi:hypothetical protein
VLTPITFQAFAQGMTQQTQQAEVLLLPAA